MIDSSGKGERMVEEAAEEGKDIRMEDLVMLCALVAKLGKR